MEIVTSLFKLAGYQESMSHADHTMKVKCSVGRHIERMKSRGTKIKRTREARARRIIENIYGVSFPKARPKWCINPYTNARLELDCYNRQLRLAFEISGGQHSRFVAHMHKTMDEFKKMKQRDHIKAQQCKRHGITLHIIPHSIHDEDLPLHIFSLRKTNSQSADV